MVSHALFDLSCLIIIFLNRSPAHERHGSDELFSVSLKVLQDLLRFKELVERKSGNK